MFSQKNPTPKGFEPSRAEHNGLAVHRLNHSATASEIQHVRTQLRYTITKNFIYHNLLNLLEQFD